MVATVAGIHLGLDTHANRPAANTVPDGSIYSCSTHSLIYRSNFAGNSWATWATLGGGAPAAHAASHEDGGADELDVTGLVGAGGGGGSYTIDAIATGVATEVTPTGTVAWADGVDGISGRDILSVKFDSIAANDASCQLIAVGSATVIETAMRYSGNNANYLMAGPCFTDGTAAGSKIIWAQVTQGPTGPFQYLYYNGTITAYGAAFTTYTNNILAEDRAGLMFLRLTMTAANTWQLEYSIDGETWTDWAVGTASSTMTPTHMGVAVSNEGTAGIKLVTFEYFKHNG